MAGSSADRKWVELNISNSLKPFHIFFLEKIKKEKELVKEFYVQFKLVYIMDDLWTFYYYI